MRNKQDNGYFCKQCGKKKWLRYAWKNAQWCLRCWKCTNTHVRFCVSDTIAIKDRIRVRRKGEVFKKFISEYLGGWFPSGDPKLRDGVYKTRNADKEKDTYDEVVKDARTGKVIHECHEPLSEHRK